MLVLELLPASMTLPGYPQPNLQPYLPQPNQRALETPGFQRTLDANTLPEGVTVGELEFGSNRFIYTYVNSTSTLGTVAIGLGVLLLLAVGLYLYDSLIGAGSGRREDEEVTPNQFYHYDPYAHSAYDETTRIKRYVA